MGKKEKKKEKGKETKEKEKKRKKKRKKKKSDRKKRKKKQKKNKEKKGKKKKKGKKNIRKQDNTNSPVGPTNRTFLRCVNKDRSRYMCWTVCSVGTTTAAKLAVFEISNVRSI
jgi:hypothetical protein